MEAKEAVAVAKAYVAELFAEEDISVIQLEELLYDRPVEAWRVTIGFDRRNPRHESSGPVMRSLTLPTERQLKVITVQDADGAVLGLTDRWMERTPSGRD